MCTKAWKKMLYNLLTYLLRIFSEVSGFTSCGKNSDKYDTFMHVYKKRKHGPVLFFGPSLASNLTMEVSWKRTFI